MGAELGDLGNLAGLSVRGLSLRRHWGGARPSTSQAWAPGRSVRDEHASCATSGKVGRSVSGRAGALGRRQRRRREENRNSRRGRSGASRTSLTLKPCVRSAASISIAWAEAQGGVGGRHRPVEGAPVGPSEADQLPAEVGERDAAVDCAKPDISVTRCDAAVPLPPVAGAGSRLSKTKWPPGRSASETSPGVASQSAGSTIAWATSAVMVAGSSCIGGSVVASP